MSLTQGALAVGGSFHRDLRPDWAVRVSTLIKSQHLNQSRLAELVGVSPMTVSRWARGEQKPTAESYIRLGNLADGRDAVYFWGQAGIDFRKVMTALGREGVANSEGNGKMLEFAPREVAR